jgi:nitric oxide reductase activation protein
MKSIFNRLISVLQNFSGRAEKGALAETKSVCNETQFADVQRRLGIYLRALWECEFPIVQTDIYSENIKKVSRPFIENDFIHLPSAYQDVSFDSDKNISGIEIYRAAAVHSAAHLIYSKNTFQKSLVDKWQQAVISVIEDARVEELTIRRFPGLKHLWSKLHTVTPEQNMTAGDYLNRLARALLDETYMDEDDWIQQGRDLFYAVGNLQDNQNSWDIGLTLSYAFKKKNIKFKSYLDKLTVPYRDDNQFIWRIAKLKDEEVTVTALNYKSILGIREVTRVEVDDKKLSVSTSNELESTTPSLETFFYPEWDFRGQLETQAWVTVREKNPKSGDLQFVDNIVEQNNHLITRMKTVLHAIRYEGVRRIRKLDEGDEIDINAAIRSQIDLRLGVLPDSRIMMRTVRKNRDISVLVLLDLSRSTMKKIQGQELTVLQLTQQVCVLFANAIASVGDPFAIHGFCSETRHRVDYYRFKDFDQPYDDIPKAKIAGMTGQRNTRMGAAIRHATYYLNMQKSRKKLLMIITDGEPSDDDVYDRQYLRVDAKKAVKDARHSGINTFCISLDPAADEYVSRIFGTRNYMVVDHVKSLPKKMLQLYATLTH